MAVAADVRASVRRIDSSITITGATSLDAILSEQLVSRRVTANVIGGFAAAALALAALGLYGLLSLFVSGRMREIGVRLAIGASPASVARRIVVDSLQTAGAGVLLGVALALTAGRLIQHLLVGVSPHDPATLVAVGGALLAIGMSAAVAPARRAARIDPVTILRAE